MSFVKLLKYGLRFLVLQTSLTILTIYYFDNYLIGDYFDGYLIIRDNLFEDRNRFYPFLSTDFIKTDIYLALFVFIFLILLYSSKFYTYVNELTFSLDKKFIDEYISLYLLWTTSFLLFIYFFRFTILSRGHLILFTLIVPIILMLFRNSELISSVLGRSVTKENYITFNLEEDSIFRSLRIMTFRKCIGEYDLEDLVNTNKIIEIIDKINKSNEVNLIIFNLDNLTKIPQELENFLLDINKKVLLISKNEVIFSKVFIHRTEHFNNFFFTYFNNDIQYGSKYIIKRFIDIVISLLGLFLLFPLFIYLIIFILIKDGSQIIVKQKRVGLHGKHFLMYKFRTMKKDSHKLRDALQEHNKGKGPLFKIVNDPRILEGAEFIRKYSLDELPQLFNVIKGDMSIVGPRPLFDEDTSKFETKYMRRLNVLPGITGLLQISDRNTDEFETWYKYDLLYIEQWSIALDLKIIFLTPQALFSSKNKGL